MRSVYDERVERGAEWLDKNEKGWMEKIDLSLLDLREDDACICGQIDASGSHAFYRYIFNKELAAAQAHELGFILWNKDEGCNALDYAKLTTAWKRLIRERRREERGT